MIASFIVEQLTIRHWGFWFIKKRFINHSASSFFTKNTVFYTLPFFGEGGQGLKPPHC